LGVFHWGREEMGEGDITALDLDTPRKSSDVKEFNYTNIVNSNQLRHYAACRKVGGLIPNEGIGFFNCPNPSSHTKALGSTQPLSQMSSRNLLGGKVRPERVEDLTTIREPIV
jgi:hypothetical protein